MNIAQCTHILFCHQIDIFIEHPIKNATTHLNIYRAVAFCMQNSAVTQCPSRQHTLNGKWRLIHWTSISITPSKCPEYGGLHHKYRCDASTHRPYYIESLALYSETILRFIYPYIWHDNMYYCMHWLFELILIAAEMGCVGWFAFGKLCVQFWKQSKNILACHERYIRVENSAISMCQHHLITSNPDMPSKKKNATHWFVILNPKSQ